MRCCSLYLIIHPIERLEYDTTLERISSTDILECVLFPPTIVVTRVTCFCSIDWPKLRDIIKYKINEVPSRPPSGAHSLLTASCQNIGAFLADSHKTSSIYVPPFSPRPSTNGGLKLPPFTSRERDESNPNEAPKAEFTEEEAAAAKEILYSQLDGFDS